MAGVFIAADPPDEIMLAVQRGLSGQSDHGNGHGRTHIGRTRTSHSRGHSGADSPCRDDRLPEDEDKNNALTPSQEARVQAVFGVT